MWVFLNDSFLSIVKHASQPDQLLIRARFAGDIERVFPQAEIIRNAGSDYRYRAVVPSIDVAKALVNRLASIDYTNFKASVVSKARHDTYMDVWTTMYYAQKDAAP